MQTFLKIFAGFVVLFVVVGLILDNQVDVKREIEINASPQEIHRYVNNLNEWPKWSPWQELDPTIKTTLGDKSQGIGASQSWKGESGSGSLKITQSTLESGIVYDMSFEGDSTKYVAGMEYEPNGKTTKVIWFMRGKMQPIIIGNYFAQMMDALVGDSFDQGLQNLKQAVETKK